MGRCSDRLIAFHITELKNLSNIKLRGLLPNRPQLDTHLVRFQQDGLVGEKVLYTWDDSAKNDKFARDMIFGKQWIHPRNAKVIASGEMYDFKYDKTVYYHAEVYVLLKIDYTEIQDRFFGRYTHAQETSVDRYNSLFEGAQEYSHTDKPLCLFKDSIDWKYLTPVCLYLSEVNRSNRFSIRGGLEIPRDYCDRF